MPFVPVPTITHVATVDTVTNPVVASQVQGSSIGAPVPFLGVDSLYWPQISGQQFPPTLGSASYLSELGLPAITFQSAAGATITYPTIARYNGTKQTLTIAGTYMVSSPSTNNGSILAETTIIALLGSGSLGIAVHTETTGTNRPIFFDVRDNAGTVLASKLAQISGNNPVAVSWSIQVNPNGSVTVTIAGVSFTSAAGLVPVTTAPQLQMRPWVTASNLEFHGPISVTYT